MSLLADPASEQALDTDGYTVVPLIGTEEIDALRECFEQIRPNPMVGFHATLRGLPLEENRRVGETIAAIMGPALASVLPGAEPIGSTFLAKARSNDQAGLLPLHQDWSSVDERTSKSVNVWCALQQVTREMGPLSVLPGSHRWFTNHRSPTIEAVQVPFDARLSPHLVEVTVPTGAAVVYDHRLFHGSLPNTTDELRLVAQVGMVPKDEPLMMTFPGPGADVELRRVPPEAFLRGLEMESGSYHPPSTPVVDLLAASLIDAEQVLSHEPSTMGPRAGTLASKSGRWRRLLRTRSS